MPHPIRRLPLGERCRSDSGASLILVLVFLLLGSLLVGGLATMAANDLLNSGNFAKARSLSYDATSAIDVAVQSIRYTPLLTPTGTLNASPPSPCWPNNSEPNTLPTTGGNHFHVWCSTMWTPTSADTRTVTLSACLSSVSAVKCAYHPLVQEAVSFDDYPPGGAPPTHEACSTYCGESMTVDKWVEHPTMPTIGLLSCAPSPGSCRSAPLGGPISGGENITITGTGFVTGCAKTAATRAGCGTTVQFVEAAGGTPAADNVVLTVTPKNVHVRSSTSLTVTAPAVTEGSTYFVRVTTPSGSSADSSAVVFTYSAASPTVTRVCTGPSGTGASGKPQTTCNTSTVSTRAKGPVAGGNELTIWGTNFYCKLSCNVESPSVEFVSGSYTVSALYVTVVAPTELSVTTPTEYEVKPPANFYVEVETALTNVAFHYVSIVPTVESADYHGPTSQTVTITGTGFVSGDDVVGFTQRSTCSDRATTGSNPWAPIAKNTSPSVQSSTTITATVPSTLKSGTTYFVTVHSKAADGTSTCYPSFEYVKRSANTTTSLSENNPTRIYGQEQGEIFTVTVVGQTNEGYPEGTVTIKTGATLEATANFTKGLGKTATYKATLSANQLGPKTYSLKAYYTPAATSSSNGNYAYTASSSSAVTFTVKP